MNHLFKDYLRQFVLVFFDDILVYSTSIQEHVVHLKQVLDVLRKEQLYAKKSKCAFGQDKIEYLGHIITGKGVKTDPAKIEAMFNWPMPKTLKSMRGFLGLTGYYRRFIKNYGWISKPLTTLLKKNAFSWGSEAIIAFQELKKAMTTAPILALAETDACAKGIGAVLMQDGRPITYFSKTGGFLHMKKSTWQYYMLLIGRDTIWAFHY